MKGAPKRAKDQTSPLYERIVHHPNITLDVNSFKADHSKYYIIDDEILFLGGINVEDKENGADMQGRVYRDYMVKMEGHAHVEAFLEKLRTGADVAKGYSFGINRKKLGLFEMEERYLSLIREARESLEIHMAYFSPLPRFLDAITEAYERGVAVTVVIPEHANYQSDSNYKTVKRLMKRTNNGIALYLTPKMAHTKLIANENWISLGSTNVTKKAFGQLDELNLFVEGKENPLAAAIRADLEGERTRAARVLSDKSLRYRPIMAWLEGFLV
jgi:cardiolipin synthase